LWLGIYWTPLGTFGLPSGFRLAEFGAPKKERGRKFFYMEDFTSVTILSLLPVQDSTMMFHKDVCIA